MERQFYGLSETSHEKQAVLYGQLTIQKFFLTCLYSFAHNNNVGIASGVKLRELAMDSGIEQPALDGGLGISSLSSLPPRPSPPFF